MDRYAKLLDVMKRGINPPERLPIFCAEVKEVSGESCTVQVGELELTEVRLKATINESANYLLQSPKVGSIVLVGSLTGDYKDLCVLKMDEVEKLEYVQDGLKFILDTTTQKITIENDQVNLKDIFESLVTLLKNFKVTTPAGPSTNILPDSLTALNEFESDFKKILN